MSCSRTRILLPALTLALTALMAPAASAEDSFGGSCAVSGSATFGTPLTFTQGPNTYEFSGTGTCDGTLNGAALTDAPIEALVRGEGNLSCGSSESTKPGPGTFVFTKGTPAKADDTTIPFTLEFTATGSEVDLTLKGERSGDGTGHASFLTPEAPPDLLAKCLTSGNEALPFDATAQTTSPFVSGPPQAKPSGSAPSPSPTPASGPGGSPTPEPTPTPTPSRSVKSPAKAKAKPKPKKQAQKKARCHKRSAKAKKTGKTKRKSCKRRKARR